MRLPHLSLGKEEEVWTTALDQLQSAVEASAEVAWTVPSQIKVPTFPKIEVPTIRFSVKAGEVDQETLEQGIYAAAGPTDPDGEPTAEGNPHWTGRRATLDPSIRTPCSVGDQRGHIGGRWGQNRLDETRSPHRSAH